MTTTHWSQYAAYQQFLRLLAQDEEQTWEMLPPDETMVSLSARERVIILAMINESLGHSLITADGHKVLAYEWQRLIRKVGGLEHFELVVPRKKGRIRY